VLNEERAIIDKCVTYRCPNPKCKISFVCQRRKRVRCFVCKTKAVEIRR
jgi:hypothetical protein